MEEKKYEKMKLEDLKIHTLRVITKGLEHPPKPKCPFIELGEKMIIGTSGMPEEDFNYATQKRRKAISYARFKISPTRNNDSSDEENDNLVFTSNK